MYIPNWLSKFSLLAKIEQLPPKARYQLSRCGSMIVRFGVCGYYLVLALGFLRRRFLSDLHCGGQKRGKDSPIMAQVLYDGC